MGHDNEKDLTITSEVIQDLGESQFHCESAGDDFDALLDNLAHSYAENFAELDIEYPGNSSIEMKCRILTTVAVHHRLKACLSGVSDRVDRLKTTGEFTPEDAGDISQLQKVLNAEEAKSPHFKALIGQVRTKIKELRDLIRFY